MSDTLPITKKTSKPKHGTITSYVVGFVLSLVFTLIPYYLVVQKSLDKNALLATIIGFAVLQMGIQVVFFLHLGREKKPRWNSFFLASTIGIIVLVVVGSIWIMNHLHYNMMAIDVTNKVSEGEAVHHINGAQTGTCSGEARVNHKVIIKNDKVSPRHTEAHLCDSLTFVNEDSKLRLVAFGAHVHHGEYAGESELTIGKGRGKTIRLTELGTYRFHDHLQEKTAGDFAVTQ